jgi:hypothetical protein
MAFDENFYRYAQFAGPKTAQEVMAEMQGAYSMLPPELQFGAAHDPAAVQAAMADYNASIARPDIAKMEARLANQPGGNSFAQARIGQREAEHQRASAMVAQDMRDRIMARWLQQRNSFFGTAGGEGGLVSRDRGGANLASLMTAGARASAGSGGEGSLQDWNGYMGQINKAVPNIVGQLAMQGGRWFKNHFSGSRKGPSSGITSAFVPLQEEYGMFSGANASQF